MKARHYIAACLLLLIGADASASQMLTETESAVSASEPMDSTASIRACGNKERKSNGILSMLTFSARGSYAFSSYRDDVLRDGLSMESADVTHLASSLHLMYAFSYGPATEAGRHCPGARQGIGVGVNLMGNPKGLGTPLSFYLLQGAPVARLGHNLSLDYEWNFGLSAGWKRCDGDIAHSNLIVGSPVNAYINLGLLLNWRVAPEWSVTGGIEVTHFSNGNTSFPNPGVNLAGLRVGLTHTFGVPPARTEYTPDTTSLRHGITFDLTAYGAWRKRVYRGGDEPVLMNGHFPLAGLDLGVMYDVCRLFRAGISADFQWDQSTDLRRHYYEGSDADDLKFYRPPFISQVCAGLSARAELVMPIFSVNFGIGYNLAGPEETHGSYQMANLKIYATPGLFVNIGYQLLNFSRQNNLMLGIGYTFRSNRPRGLCIF